MDRAAPRPHTMPLLLAVGLAHAGGVVAYLPLVTLLLPMRVEALAHLAKIDLLARPRFGFGALCIFLYVGAEVAIGSIVINYLTLDDVLGRPESVIGWMVSLYWGGAMIGRFIGSALLRLVSPGKILAAVAVGAIALIALSTTSSGTLVTPHSKAGILADSRTQFLITLLA